MTIELSDAAAELLDTPAGELTVAGFAFVAAVDPKPFVVDREVADRDVCDLSGGRGRLPERPQRRHSRLDQRLARPDSPLEFFFILEGPSSRPIAAGRQLDIEGGVALDEMQPAEDRPHDPDGAATETLGPDRRDGVPGAAADGLVDEPRRVFLRPEFAAAGLDGLIDSYVLSFEHGVQKPDPEIFRIAAESLAIGPHELLMVGDHVTRRRSSGPRIITLLLPPLRTADASRNLGAVLALTDTDHQPHA